MISNIIFVVIVVSACIGVATALILGNQGRKGVFAIAVLVATAAAIALLWLVGAI